MIEANKKEELAILEAYRRLYKNSTPSADFDRLMEVAKLNSEGKKIIKYWNYTISESSYEEIITKIIKEFKISKIRAGMFKTAIALGVSPKFKK